ncbi:MAG: hypothetical protein WC934_14705 [Acidithiobacillus sp.]|jgi:hypothetical protein|uniref:hypothetical protein n=1 Tax=Acidithiobacillus sp. TaxID=1872118 RepID=UPI00355ECE23
MTAPSANSILTNVKNNVISENQQFPTEDPGATVPEYCDDFDEYKNTETLNPDIMFQPLHLFNYLINIVNTIDDSWKESYLEICDGIELCWQNWQNSFTVTGHCTILPITPAGSPTTGSISGGFITPYHFNSSNLISCTDMTYLSTRDIGVDVVTAIGNTFASQLEASWQIGYTKVFNIIGTPGVVNIPFLVSTGSSSGETSMTQFGNALVAQYGSIDNITNLYLRSLGDAITSVFATWKTTNSISGIVAGGTIGMAGEYTGGPGTGGLIS